MANETRHTLTITVTFELEPIGLDVKARVVSCRHLALSIPAIEAGVAPHREAAGRAILDAIDTASDEPAGELMPLPDAPSVTSNRTRYGGRA